MQQVSSGQSLPSGEHPGDGRVKNLFTSKRSGESMRDIHSSHNVASLEDGGIPFLEAIAEPAKRKLGSDFKRREAGSRTVLHNNSGQKVTTTITRIPSILNTRNNNQAPAGMVEEFLNQKKSGQRALRNDSNRQNTNEGAFFKHYQELGAGSIRNSGHKLGPYRQPTLREVSGGGIKIGVGVSGE